MKSIGTRQAVIDGVEKRIEQSDRELPGPNSPEPPAKAAARPAKSA